MALILEIGGLRCRVLFGDPETGDTGFFGKHGEEAMHAAPAVGKQLNEISERIGGGLANARQRLEFNEYTRRLRVWTDRDVLTHYEKEMSTYGQETQKARAGTAVETAGNYFNNEQRIQQAIDEGNSAVVREMQGRGFGPTSDATVKAVNDQQDRIAASVIQGFLANNDHAGAERWIKSHQGLITNPRVAETINREVHSKAIDADVKGIIFGGGGNNNVGNIRVPGSTGTDKTAFQSFPTVEDGVGAIKGNLLAYQDRHGIQTVAGIVARWSPPNENDTPRLIAAAAKFVGVGPNDPINLHNPETMQKMIQATINNEGTKAPPEVVAKVAQSSTIAPGFSFSGAVAAARDKYQNPEDFSRALSTIENVQRMVNLEDTARARQEHEANQKAAGEITAQILKPGANLEGLADQISESVRTGKLNWETGRSLTAMLDGHAAGDIQYAITHYGPGYWEAYKQITLSANDPNRLSDVNAVLRRAGPGGDLTTAGVDKLINVMQSKKLPIGEAQAQLERQIFVTAHSEIAGINEIYGKKDPKGEALMQNFIVQATPIIQDAINKGKLTEIAGDKGPIQALIDKIKRPPEVWLRDYTSAETQGQTKGPAPPIARPAVRNYDEQGNLK